MLQIREVIILTFVTLIVGKEPVFKLKPRTTECGTTSCHPPRPGYINVHLVPHSHDDTGWLKTVDQYYYGAGQRTQRAGVQYIIESVVKELASDPDKRFIQVETGFFWRWWEDKGEFMRNVTRQLVEAGQLVFTGGGWSMNDEAATHYTSIIDNMETGLNWLVDTLGHCAVPDIAWQIDPFGHSKEQARLFAEMGYKGLFFARIDYRDKEVRKAGQSLQMLWEGGKPDDPESTIFTGVFDKHYSNPDGFCFDIICEDEPINDDPRLEEFNVDQRMAEFESYVLDHLRYYKDQEHIMFTMGDDFQYQNARMNYKNIDKIIKHMNAKTEETGIHLLYSTPDCYLSALQSNGLSYSIKQDDFFPYASGEHSYWTGYFSSRPSVKLQERIGARDLTVTRQVGILSKEAVSCEFDLHRVMGLMQHHDAVTGTEKQHVAEDYALRLDMARAKCHQETRDTLLGHAGLDPAHLDLSVTSCPRLNITECEVSELAERFIITVYNPLSRVVREHLRVPVSEPGYSVYDHLGQVIRSQVNEIPEHIKTIPGRVSLAQHELIFPVTVPALGYTMVYLQKEGTMEHIDVRKIESLEDQQSFDVLSSTHVDMQYYTGWKNSWQSSGAYVFRPDSSGRQPISASDPLVTEVRGPVVNETFIRYADWAVVSMRQYSGQENVTEVTWQVGPLVDGKEVVMVYSTDLNTREFHTDSNGRQMIKRTYSEDTAEPAAGNYYPVTTRLELRTGEKEAISVITDRSQGGSSLHPGEMELMVHRRCVDDDGYGVGEALKEEAYGVGLVARGQHFIHAGATSEARMLQQEKVLTPQLFFLATDLSLDQWTEAGLRPYSGIVGAKLPESVQILTLSKWKNTNEVLLRFQHIFDTDEDDAPISVEVSEMFTEFNVLSLELMKLAADRSVGTLDGLQFELKPLEIKTFVARVEWIA